MGGELLKDLVPFLTWLVTFYKVAGVLIGFIGGYFTLVFVSRLLDEIESWEIYFVFWVFAILLGPGVHFGVPFLVKRFFETSISGIYLVIWIAGFAVGLMASFWYSRHGTRRMEKLKLKLKLKTEAERDLKTDVRTVRELLPETPDYYNIMDFYEPGFVTLGLDKSGQPVRIPFDFWCSSHLQLIGTTGSGKGVAAQMALVQALHQGEAVFVFDPKDDEWLPHVLHQAAKANDVPYHFIDLREGKGQQINPLMNIGKSDLKELLMAAFSLSDKGTEADHYRIGDRKAAGIVAEFMSQDSSPGFAASLNEILEFDSVKAAAGFLGKFEEMAELDTINASAPGVDFSEVIEKGGVVYIVGSMRQETVKRAQRLLMVRLVQICEQRNRLVKQRPVVAFLDELKYHLSKPAMEIFGAARDKGLHALVAHQSQGDLRDVPQDLDADAVVSSVIENTALKIVYRLQDPDTAEWIAKRSGIKLVDEEIRNVGRNIALTEKLNEDRMLRQGETYLIDTNMLMNLPERVAVLFSQELPDFIGTSPVIVPKSAEAIEPHLQTFKQNVPIDIDPPIVNDSEAPEEHDEVETTSNDDFYGLD